MKLPITQFGHPILRIPGKPVTAFDDTLQKLFDDMVETCGNSLGLAAQQVDKDLQFFISNISLDDSRIESQTCIYDGKTVPIKLIMPLAVANAQIIKASTDTVFCEEGCLSFSGGIYGEIERHFLIEIKFQDLQGNYHTLECTDLFAVNIQHEYDHTQGVLFIDRMDKRTLKRLEPKLKKLKRQTRDELKQKNNS